MLHFAHISHYMWALYLPPFLIVGVAIVKSALAQRELRREEAAEGEFRPGA